MAFDLIQLMSNIILIAHSDGKVTSREQSIIELARTELKIKKNEYSAAAKYVEQGSCKITPVGSFSNRVLNLEWMLKVALADNELGEKESSLINQFAQEAGIYPDQVEKIRLDALSSAEAHSIICPGCGTAADQQARFCQKCGANLSQDEAIQVEIKIPASGIAIEFAEPTAASFPKALEVAKLSNDFQSCQRNKKSWYLAAYQDGNIEQVVPLCQALSGIRNRHVYINGEEHPWDEIFGFIWCSGRRAVAYKPIEYCFGKDENRLNIWGCMQANMEWTEWARWFSYGQWEKGGFLSNKLQFRFDKKRIQHELSANLFKVRFCPYFRSDLLPVVLKNLPEMVSPESDQNWGYKRTSDQGPGSIKVTEKCNGYSMDYWSDGVSPRGLSLFNEILLKSLKEIGRSPILLK